jgi:hypothetical protein
MPLVQTLLAVVRAHTRGTAAEWFETAREVAARGSVAQLLRIYTEASRHLGQTPLVTDGSDANAVRALDNVPARHWTLEDAGRLVFVVTRYEAVSGTATEWIAACYEQGDTREQRSWLRTVAFIPRAELMLPVAVDACRTSIVPLFEAIACENPYPARYFPDRNFNQVVLKALFNGIAVERITGLASRLNPELSRMASDYADERRAAGRSIPTDIDTVILSGAGATRNH